jgi:ATP-binding cassette subfamily A (ABC1) protein 3
VHPFVAEAAVPDDDVSSEETRIATTSLYDLQTTDAVIISALSKTYSAGSRQVIAVNQLSFGVRRGECFGLLGINGAGKTTTFQMLTGDVVPSGGDAYINKFSIRESMYEVCLCATCFQTIDLMTFVITAYLRL